jgi:hypothetical protein
MCNPMLDFQNINVINKKLLIGITLTRSYTMYIYIIELKFSLEYLD